MKGYLDAKELESYKKEDLQELAKQLGVDAEGTKKEIATRCAAVEVDIPDESELTEEDKRAAEEAAAEAAVKTEEEEATTELVKVKAQRRFLDKELNQIKDTGDEYAVSRERAAVLEEAGAAVVIETWQLRICQTMQIKWVLTYRLYRTPITVLQSRIIPCWIT